MAGDWMKVEKVTPQKPEILEMAAMLELSPDDVFGKLFRIWAWADDHTEDGNAHGVTPALLDSTMSVTGFARAMQEVGWLELIGKSDLAPRGGVRFVNFERHNGQTGKRRALTAMRVAKSRSVTPKICNASSVTESLPEQSRAREEKSLLKAGEMKSLFACLAPEQQEAAEDLAKRISRATKTAIASDNGHELIAYAIGATTGEVNLAAIEDVIERMYRKQGSIKKPWRYFQNAMQSEITEGNGHD